MPLPTVNSDQLIANSRYIAATKKQRVFEDQLVIPSGCPSLDYITGVGGLPRGRMIEIYGGEATGKCVVGETVVAVPGEGLVTMDELKEKAQWREEGDILPDSQALLGVAVQAAHGETEATQMYFAGQIGTVQIHTEQGHKNRGAASHRLLTLADNGIARWVTLKNARPGDQLIILIGGRVTGNRNIEIKIPPDHVIKIENKEAAALLGALATAEIRSDGVWLSTITGMQRKVVREWAKILLPGVPSVEETGEFTRFTGLMKLSPLLEKMAEYAITPECLQQVRRAKLEIQEAWAAGFSITKGRWTQDYLEIELSSQETAKTFQAVCNNLGIRWQLFPTLSTFGDKRTKLALHSRIDQQVAEEVLWKDWYIPSTWQKRYSPEYDECHPRCQKTLNAAKVILERKVGQQDIETEDLTKENLQDVATRLRPHARTKVENRVLETLDLMALESTATDRVVGIEKAQIAPCWDVHVPIGHHYTANTAISHNSTLAMHMCQQELINRKDSAVVYYDFERSTAKEYATKMGLLEHGNRFALLDPDSIEEVNEIQDGFFKAGVIHSIVVLDSVAAMTPKALYGRDMENTPPIGLQARKLTELFGKWSKIAGDYGVIFLCINQTRAYIATEKWQQQQKIYRRIPGMPGTEDEDTPGGKAAKFYYGMRIRLQARKVVLRETFNPMIGENVQTPIANIVRAVVAKNKVAAPFKQGQFYITFGVGVDSVRTMKDLAETQGLIKKGGGGYITLTLPSGLEIKGRGEEKFVDNLKASKAAVAELAKALQWDKVKDLEAQGESVVTKDLMGGGSDDSSDQDKIAALAESGVSSSLLAQAPLLTQKADLLGLLEKPRSNVVGFTPEGGVQIRAKTTEGLEKKLTPEFRTELQGRVDEAAAQLASFEAEANEGEETQDSVSLGALDLDESKSK